MDAALEMGMSTLDRILEAMDSDAFMFTMVGVICLTLMIFLGYVFATLGAQIAA